MGAVDETILLGTRGLAGNASGRSSPNTDGPNIHGDMLARGQSKREADRAASQRYHGARRGCPDDIVVSIVCRPGSSSRTHAGFYPRRLSAHRAQAAALDPACSKNADRARRGDSSARDEGALTKAIENRTRDEGAAASRCARTIPRGARQRLEAYAADRDVGAYYRKGTMCCARLTAWRRSREVTRRSTGAARRGRRREAEAVRNCARG